MEAVFLGEILSPDLDANIQNGEPICTRKMIAEKYGIPRNTQKLKKAIDDAEDYDTKVLLDRDEISQKEAWRLVRKLQYHIFHGLMGETFSRCGLLVHSLRGFHLLVFDWQVAASCFAGQASQFDLLQGRSFTIGLNDDGKDSRAPAFSFKKKDG